MGRRRFTATPRALPPCLSFDSAGSVSVSACISICVVLCCFCMRTECRSWLHHRSSVDGVSLLQIHLHDDAPTHPAGFRPALYASVAAHIRSTSHCPPDLKSKILVIIVTLVLDTCHLLTPPLVSHRRGRSRRGPSLSHDHPSTAALPFHGQRLRRPGDRQARAYRIARALFNNTALRTGTWDPNRRRPVLEYQTKSGRKAKAKETTKARKKAGTEARNRNMTPHSSRERGHWNVHCGAP